MDDSRKDLYCELIANLTMFMMELNEFQTEMEKVAEKKLSEKPGKSTQLAMVGVIADNKPPENKRYYESPQAIRCQKYISSNIFYIIK